MTTPRWRVPLALVLALGLTAAACGSDDSGSSSDTTDSTAEAIEGSTIRFAPQDFAESKTLTEVYAQYLEAQGFDVEVQPASGFRDQVYPGPGERRPRHHHRLHGQRHPLPRPGGPAHRPTPTETYDGADGGPRDQ